METRGLCIKDNVGHGETIHPNGEGGPCFSATRNLNPWETTRATPRDKVSGQDARV